MEEAEAVVESFQRSEPVLEIGDPEAAYEAFMVGQLQAEIIEMHVRLEEERSRGRELEEQIKANNSNLQESQYKTNKQNTKPCNAKGKSKVRHQDAILQLQMELDSVDGGASPLQAINKQLQLDMEALKSTLAEERQHLTEAQASSNHLRQQLENLTQAKLKAEKALDSSANLETTENDLKSINREDGKELEWEGAALRMFDYLLEELPFSPSFEKVFQFEDPLQQDNVEKHNAIFLSLKERLLHAQMLANSADKKLQAIDVLMYNSMGSCPDTCIMESVLQTYQNVKSAKKNLEACNENVREVGQKSAFASIMEWWLSEIAIIQHEAWDGKKRQLGAEKELLEIQVQSSIDLLENILSELRTTEAQLQQIVDTSAEEFDKKQTREQALATAVAEAEQRYIDLQHQVYIYIYIFF